MPLERTMLLPPQRIYLIGFMGSGKSTVGPLLADRLQWTFLDLDSKIEREQGCTILEIFQQKGESSFRQMEREALRQTSQLESAIIALGGGAYTLADNREWIQQSGISVFLDCPWEIVLQRCTGDNTRPLFQDTEKVKTLFETRKPLYQLCHTTVEVGPLQPEQVVDSILIKLREQGSILGEVNKDEN
jgi:shikimate kinase